MRNMQQWQKNFLFKTATPDVAQVVCALATGNPITTTTQTAIVLNVAGPINGVFIQLVNGSDTERVFVVSGGGSVNLTVLRAATAFTFAVSGTVVTLPGSSTFMLQPIAKIPNREIKGAKVTTDINYQVILPAVGDSLPQGATSIILADTSPNLGTLNLLAPRGSTTWMQFPSAGAAGSPGSGATPVAVITGVVGVDASTLLISDPNYHVRWQDKGGGLHVVINVTVSVSTVGYVSIWLNLGAGQIWMGWWSVTASGQVISIGLQGGNPDNIYPPTVTAGSWTATVGGGEIPSAGAIPGGAITSTAFAVPTPATPASTAATGCYIDAIIPVAAAGGAIDWGWGNLFATLPYLDPEFWYADFTVQNGQYISSVWTPGGQHGGNETSFCQVGPQSVDSYYGPGGTTPPPASISLGPSQVSLYNQETWTSPSDSNLVFKFRCYVYSRKGTTALPSPGTGVLQNAWSSGVGVSTAGTAAFQDVTISAAASNIDLGHVTTTLLPSYNLDLDGATVAVNPYTNQVISISAPGANLLSNPGAEFGTTGIVFTGATPFTVSAAQFHSGSKSFAIIGSGSLIISTMSWTRPASPGQVFTGEAWGYGDAGSAGGIFITVAFLDSTGATIGTATTIGTSATLTAGWVLTSGSQTPAAPTGTVNAKFTVHGQNSGSSGAGIYVDDVAMYLCTSAALLAANAVLGVNMSTLALAAATTATAAAAVVNPLLLTMSMTNVTYGTAIFANNVVLSRGIGLPVIVLSNASLTLFGQADASTGATGLLTQPYVAIASTGVLVASGGTGPSVFLTGGSTVFYSVHLSLTHEFIEVTPGLITIQSAPLTSGTFSGYYLQTLVSAAGITMQLTDGTHFPNIMALSGSGMTITAGSFSQAFTASKIQMLNGSSAVFTLDTTGIHIAAALNVTDPTGVTPVATTSYNPTGPYGTFLLKHYTSGVFDGGVFMDASAAELQMSIGSALVILTPFQFQVSGLPTAAGGGSKQLYYNPSDSNRVYYAP